METFGSATARPGSLALCLYRGPFLALGGSLFWLRYRSLLWFFGTGSACSITLELSVLRPVSSIGLHRPSGGLMALRGGRVRKDLILSYAVR